MASGRFQLWQGSMGIIDVVNVAYGYFENKGPYTIELRDQENATPYETLAPSEVFTFPWIGEAHMRTLFWKIQPQEGLPDNAKVMIIGDFTQANYQES